MFNPFSEINWHPSPAERRAFGRSLVAGFPALAAVLLLASGLWSGTWRVTPFAWLAVIGAAAGALFAACPFLAKPFYLAWHFLACCIGALVGNTLLAAFYLLILTPVGLAGRALGRRVICRSLDKSRPSYWVDVAKTDDAVDYFRQF